MTSRDLEGSSRDLNTLGAQYLENSWRCYLATVAKVWSIGRNPHKRTSWKLVGNPGHELVAN